MDFNDVFGGPPRRFSMQEVRVRYSFGDSEEDRDSSPWIAIKEKPVFGEESTAARRRRQGDDFFDDIFRVDESHGSPRRTDGLIGSNPGSRIMSPVRTFSPKAEPFGTSLPAQFSLPTKSTKIMEFPTFGSPDYSPHKMDNTTNGLNSPYSSSASLSRFSNQSIRAHEDIKNEALPVYRHSPLSRQASKNDTKTVDNDSSQFHFSIYKWAGKGVPMLIPLVGRNNLSTKDNSFNDPSKNLEPESLKMESKEDDSRGREVKTQENEKAIAFKQNIEIEQVKSVDGIGIEKKITNEIVEPELKENKSRSPKKAQSKAGKIAKKNDGARNDSNRENIDEYSYQGNVTEKIENKTRSPDLTQFEAGKNAKKNEGSLQGAALNSQPSRGKSRVKGMVKDFVHVFNQEADPSPKANSQTKNSRSRWKTVNMNTKQNEVSPNAAKYDFSQPSSRVDENLNKDEEQKCTTTETSIHKNDHFSTNQKSAYSSEPLNQDSKISVENSDDPFEDNFLVQELSDDLEKSTQNDEVSEDLKDLDAKIRQWSFGRKGNIRSLLSTLQLVLWPGSGWKPVPLMDLIEANSVKRAYQKALLRLHPDKLQQKGADSHHKYIAEKVFDILQEAWDHFNTLAPI